MDGTSSEAAAAPTPSFPPVTPPQPLKHFADPALLFICYVERLSTKSAQVPRVLLMTQQSIAFCAENGAVKRFLPITSIRRILTSQVPVKKGCRSVLLCVETDGDLLLSFPNNDKRVAQNFDDFLRILTALTAPFPELCAKPREVDGSLVEHADLTGATKAAAAAASPVGADNMMMSMSGTFSPNLAMSMSALGRTSSVMMNDFGLPVVDVTPKPAPGSDVEKAQKEAARMAAERLEELKRQLALLQSEHVHACEELDRLKLQKQTLVKKCAEPPHENPVLKEADATRHATHKLEEETTALMEKHRSLAQHRDAVLSDLEAREHDLHVRNAELQSQVNVLRTTLDVERAERDALVEVAVQKRRGDIELSALHVYDTVVDAKEKLLDMKRENERLRIVLRDAAGSKGGVSSPQRRSHAMLATVI
eukprot:PhM_4_TR3922/c0_g1_i1/m.12971